MPVYRLFLVDIGVGEMAEQAWTFCKTFLTDDAKGLDLLGASLGTSPSQGMMMMSSL